VIPGLLGDLLDSEASAFHPMTSMDSSWVIISVAPPVGMDAQDPGGALDRPGGSRPGGTQESAQRGFG
jgi:hypothetical protein